MNIRKATEKDLSRIAEIHVFNNRTTYYPIFHDEAYSFGYMQVIPIAEEFARPEILSHLYVYDDGTVRGYMMVEGTEICKLYVDPFFQGRGYGAQLLEFAVKEFGADRVWALEKNTRAVAFYEKNGFHRNGERRLQEGTTEDLVRLVR